MMEKKDAEIALTNGPSNFFHILASPMMKQATSKQIHCDVTGDVRDVTVMGQLLQNLT